MNDSQVSDGAGVSLPLRKGRPGHPYVVGNQPAFLDLKR